MEAEFFWKVLDFLFGMLDIGIYYWFMSKTLGKQTNAWLPKVGFIVQYVVLRVGFLSGIPVTLKLFLAAGVGFVCFYFSYRTSLPRIIVMHILWLMAMMGSEIISYGVLIVTQKADTMQQMMSSNAILFEGTIMSKAFLFILIIFMKRWFGQEQRQYSIRETLLIILELITNVITINVLASLAAVGVEKTGISPIWLTSIGVVSLVALIVCVSITTEYFKSQERERQYILMQAESERMYSVYQEKQESSRELHRMYHDIRNHMHALETLACTNPEVQQYVESMNDQIEPVTYITDTGNPIADTVLFDKITVLKNQGVKVNVGIEENSLRNVDAMEACVILSNALDNIIEATNEIKQAFASLTIVNEGFETIIHFSNSCDSSKIRQNQEGKYRTIKSDSKTHGWGLDSINSIIDKLGGILTIKSDNNVFELTVIMPNRLS